MEAINDLRAECVRHYAGRRHSPDHAELIVPKDEAEIRRIYGCIQKEKEMGYTPPPNPFSYLFAEETTAD